MYLVFLGDVYYPCGGFNDFFGQFLSLEAAIEAAQKECQHEIERKWWHIVNVETHGIVICSEIMPYQP